ncbi:MAG: phosphatidate cytidylyltransferase [Clostridia bacterium]|nr:phosphatidate cytidylyltransferase [Clostridia bacterium]
MHKTRIISGGIGFILLVAVILAGSMAFTAAITLLSLIGMFEFYNAVSKGGYKPVRIIGYISCLVIFIVGLQAGENNLSFLFNIEYITFGLFAMICILFSYVVFTENKVNINDISLTFFGIFYVVFLFSFVVLTRNMEAGQYYIWLVFIGAFATDTFAYIFGNLIGKTKILPVISPKKSLEGSIGGIVGCVLLMLIYGLIIDSMGWVKDSVALYHFIVIGILCGVISQIGDWAASAIKRYIGVKDYGRIMPGHGGVLDRFDSILFVAPVIYFYFSFFIR